MNNHLFKGLTQLSADNKVKDKIRMISCSQIGIKSKANHLM